MMCDTEQQAAQICANCGLKMGEYYCGICKLFDDDNGSKQPFHCSDCGICRNGGRENTFHCEKCGCCYVIGKHDSDVCLENATKNNCSVCNEYLFDSYKEVIVVYCGHAFHKDCFPEMFSQHRCPICFQVSMPRQQPSKDQTNKLLVRYGFRVCKPQNGVMFQLSFFLFCTFNCYFFFKFLILT